jgi:hypothetical protein
MSGAISSCERFGSIERMKGTFGRRDVKAGIKEKIRMSSWID